MLPDRDFAHQLTWMADARGDGEFRVLWAGQPEAVPGDPWRLDDGLAYASTRNGTPDLTDQWAGSDQGSTGLLADALGVARRGETSRLGHLLAPLGVRYVAVPLRAGPIRSDAPRLPAPIDLLDALRAQIDLKLIDTDPAIVVYENAAWAPSVSVLPPAALEPSRGSGPESARTTELAGAPPALEATGPFRYEGAWPGPELLFSESYSSRWRFTVDGDAAAHRKAFGWSNAYSEAAGDKGVLAYRTSPVRYAGLVLQGVLWFVAARLVLQGMRRRRMELA
jgi:hypothetical protein